MTDARVTGAIRYSQDIRAEGMLHARLVRSPVAHARIVSIDTSAVPDDVVVSRPASRRPTRWSRRPTARPGRRTLRWSPTRLLRAGRAIGWRSLRARRPRL